MHDATVFEDLLEEGKGIGVGDGDVLDEEVNKTTINKECSVGKTLDGVFLVRLLFQGEKFIDFFTAGRRQFVHLLFNVGEQLFEAFTDDCTD